MQTQSISLRGTCHYRAETTFWWNVLHFCLILHLLAWRCFYCIYVILQSSGMHRWHVMWFQAHDDKTFMCYILLAGVRQTAHKFITEILCFEKKLRGLLSRPAIKCWMVSNAFFTADKMLLIVDAFCRKIYFQRQSLKCIFFYVTHHECLLKDLWMSELIFLVRH